MNWFGEFKLFISAADRRLSAVLILFIYKNDNNSQAHKQNFVWENEWFVHRWYWISVLKTIFTHYLEIITRYYRYSYTILLYLDRCKGISWQKLLMAAVLTTWGPDFGLHQRFVNAKENYRRIINLCRIPGRQRIRKNGRLGYDDDFATWNVMEPAFWI